MADANTNKDLVINEEHVTLSSKRCSVAMEATYEIDKLVDTMRNAVELTEDGGFYVVRALATRIEELNHVIMRALGDEQDETKHLSFLLTRKRGDEVAA